MSVLMVTGHRPNKLWGYDLSRPEYGRLKEKMAFYIRSLSPEYCLSGMALGVDQLFAQTCVELQVPWYAIVPCKGQECKWPASSKNAYYRLIKASNGVYLVTNTAYTPGCMQTRNCFMVDKSTHILAVWDGTKGGTGNCLQYAMEQQKAGRDIKWARINPADI